MKKMNRKIGSTRYITPDNKRVIGTMKWKHSPFHSLCSGLNEDEVFLLKQAMGVSWKVSKAKATCCDNDKYDVDIGKHIVDLKLNLKWNDYMARKARQLSKKFDSLSLKMLKKAYVYEKNSFIVEREIKAICGDEN